MFDDMIFKELNEEQIEAVKATEGYVRVIAGAGTGKTRALANRYAYLVKYAGVSTKNILCITFTNKSAQEMKKRIKSILGNQYGNFLVYTYHGFCIQILREDIHCCHYPKNFLVIDTEDQKSILREIYEELGLKLNDKTFKSVMEEINNRKKSFDYVKDLVSREPIELDETEGTDIFHRYLRKQRKNFALDFMDLMNFVFYIFKYYPDKLEKWQERMEYIQVDEFQDTSSGQYAFITLLSKINKNLFIVGDPDQTLYSWRGAMPEYIINFDKEFENVTTILLNKNYRSTQRILDISNSLIKNNVYRIENELLSVNAKEADPKVIHYHGQNEQSEHKWISEKIVNLMNCGAESSEIAIIYRAHYQSRSIEQMLHKTSIKYDLYGGIKFYERKEIKDIISFLRLLVYEDDLSLKRVINLPARGMGKTKILNLVDKSESLGITMYEALKDSLSESKFKKTNVAEFIRVVEKYKEKKNELYLTELCRDYMEEIGYEKMVREDGDHDRLDNIQELYNSMKIFENDYQEEFALEDYLTAISLYSDIDKEEKCDKIRLMTGHIAKGLEFDYVFLIGLTEGQMPSSRSLTPDKLEEERRIAYVAMTRAKKGLFLTDSSGYSFSGVKYSSRFLFEVDREKLLVEGEFDQKSMHWENTYPKIDQNKIVFEKGDKVKHFIFGEGVISLKNIDDQIYVVEFADGEKIRSIRFDSECLEHI